MLTSTVNVALPNQAPTLATSSTLNYLANQAATVINSVVVASDVDNTTLSSATVRVSANYVSSEDVLGFVGTAATGNITGSFNPTTGILTLTSSGSTATVSQFQAALRLVTYRNTNGNPSLLSRSIAYQVSDGSDLSNVLTSTVNVALPNQAPTLAGTSSLNYLANQATTVVNSVVVVGDVDNMTLSSATVQISANYLSSEDVLGFVGTVATGNITGSFNPTTGILTLTSVGSTATVGEFQSALRLVTYRNTNGNPSLLPRSIAYQVSDGSNLSNILTSTVTVTSSNDAPTLVGTSSLIYKERQAAAIVNSVLAVGDLDHTTLSSATVLISANYIAGEDVLEFVGTTTTGNITGSFDPVSGTLTLQSAGSTATLAQFQAALRLVKYSNASFNPTSAVRTVSYQVSDGTLSSNVMTSLITVVPANNSPTVSGTSVLAYTEKDVAQVINPSIVVADVDNALVSATVRISANNSATQDVLGFVGDATTGNIIGSFSGGSLVLISPGGTATVAQFQAALRRVTYVNTSANPSTLPRSVTYQVSDGTILSTAVTSTINVTPVNDAPTLVGASTLIYTPNQVATAVNKTVVLTDADNTTLASATVRISSNYVAAEDRLGFVGTATTGNIVGSFNAATGTMTLTSAGATATIAQFMAAIRLVTYQNISSTPTTAPRSIQYQVFDATLGSNLVTSLVTIKGTGAAPVVGGQATSLSYSEKQAATVVNSTVTVSDADSATLAWATVRISANLKATEDVLDFVGNASTGNITGSYSPSTGTLLLISEGATATAGEFQAALRLVTYRNTSANPSLLARSIAYQISDGSNLSNLLNSTVNVTSSNDAPTLAGTSSLIYKERQAAAIVNSVLAVGDLDHTTLSSATVRISANYVAGEDVLEFVGTTTTGNITGSFDPVSGTLTLQSAGSTATLAQFQAALRLVKYSNASFNPTSAVRTVSYQVSDGTLSSNVMTSLITVVPANNSPTVSGTSVLAYTEKDVAQVINPSIVVADVDNALVSATVRISANNSATQDVLGFVGDATTGNIIGSFSGGSLVLISPGGTATVAQFQAALRRVTYVNTSANPSTLPRSVTYQVSDGTILSTAVTSTINVTPVNDAPTLVGASTLIYTPNQVATAVNKTVVLTDADNTTLASATVRISSNYVAAEDRLGFVGTTTTGNIVGSFNTATGTMTLTSAGATATIAQFMAAIRLVTYQNISATPTTAPRSIQYQVFDATLGSNLVTSLVTIKGTGTAPVTGGDTTTLSYSEKQPATVVNSTVTVSDADSATLAWATVRISANLKATEDVLDFVGNASTGNIIGTYSPSTGTLTLISEGALATAAQFEAALRLVTYRNTSANPSLLSRSIAYQVSDGSNLSNILTSTVTINS